MSNQQTNLKGSFNQLESTLDLYFVKKAPALPANIKELIVKFGPYLVLLSIIVSLPAILTLLGLGAFLMPFGYGAGAGYGLNYTISILFLLVNVVMMALALPGLFKRTLSSWRLLFYASLLSIVSSLVSFNFVGALINAVISFYFLFQIKSYYK